MSRGTWNVDKAIKSLWDAKQLDQKFRAVWPNGQNVRDFLPLNDREARASRGNQTHPMPYAVFDKDDPLPLGGASGGDSAHVVRYYDIPVQFTVYGSHKPQCIEFADKVATAFDRALLDLGEDIKHIETFNDGDMGRRIDDEMWSWVIMYRFRIETAFLGELSPE